MKVVMFYEVAPEGMARAAENFPAHRARLDDFHSRGTLLMAGPFTVPGRGAMGIFTTRAAAEEFIAGDPFVINGVVGKYTLEDWNEVLA